MNTSLNRFKALLAQVSYAGLTLECGFDGWQSPPSESPNYFLRWTDPSATCNTSGEALHSKGRKWRLSQHMVDGEVVGTAFLALLTYLEHEARERFTFQGVSVYDSHVDIHKLVALRKEPDALDHRKAPNDAGPIAHSVLHGWGFWDETWSHFHGGFPTEDHAKQALRVYAWELANGPLKPAIVFPSA